MRDEQVRRYARHILLPDVGGLGQTALMVAGARVAVDGEPSAALIAASYLAAGGVGALVVRGATDAQLAGLAAHGPDSRIVSSDTGVATNDGAGTDRTLALAHAKEVQIDATPAWWPIATNDATALAYWRGGIAATRWMAAIVNR